MNDDTKMMSNKDELVKDFVCGMTKPKSQMKARAVYKDKTYYFCWEGDKNIFTANPEHWIPRDQKEDVIKK